LDTGAGLRPEPPSAARLLIHSMEPCAHGASPFESALHRLRSRYALGKPADAHAPLVLLVHDLKGQRLEAFDDAGELTELVLPAGTYHVTASLGSLRRSYTMTLEPGASVDLHLRLVAQSH